MEHFSLIFAAAFAAALVVLYLYGKAIQSVDGYIAYRQSELQRQYHIKQLQVFIDAADKIDNVIEEMSDAIPVNDRRQSLKYADFETIDRILKAVSRVADKANRLNEVFAHDFAFAQQSKPVADDLIPEDVFNRSFDFVRLQHPSLTKSKFWKLLNGIGIYSAAELYRRGPTRVEQTIISKLTD